MSVMNLDKKKVNYKFISIGFKQNLGSECSKFYFKDQNKKKKFKNFIYKFFFFLFWAKPRDSFKPPGLAVEPPVQERVLPKSKNFILYQKQKRKTRCN